MSRERQVATASVLVLVVAALAVVFAPGVLPDGLVAPAAGVSPGWVLRAIGVVLLLGAGGRFLLGLLAGAGSSDLASEAPSGARVFERPAGDTHEVVGGRLDTQLDAIQGHHDAIRADVVRDELRPLAVELVGRVEEIDRKTARTRVARGEWTDDPRASAFFATEPVAVPLWIRIVDRLSDEPRRYRHAIHAIDAMAAYRSRLRVPVDRSDPGERPAGEGTNSWAGTTAINAGGGQP